MIFFKKIKNIFSKIMDSWIWTKCCPNILYDPKKKYYLKETNQNNSNYKALVIYNRLII